MKRNIAWTVLFSTTFLLSLASVRAAEDGHACSRRNVAGQWGYTLTGTLLPGSGSPTLFAAVGKFNLDAQGNTLGTQTSSLDGTVAEDTTKGTITVNPDCTGTWSVSVYDQAGTTLLRTAVWAVLFVDNATEFRAIEKSAVLIPDTTLAPVATMDAKKLLPHSRR